MGGGTNIANMNATLTLSEFEFVNGLKQSEAAAMQFARTTEQSAERAGAALRKANSDGFSRGGMEAFKNGAYAVQDFTSQINNGLGPAMNAISNNVLQMATAIPGPWKAVGIAVAVATPLIIANYDKIGSALGLMVSKSKEELDKYSSDWDAITKKIQSSAKIARDAESMSLREFDAKQDDRRQKWFEMQAEQSRLAGAINSKLTGSGGVETDETKLLREKWQKLTEAMVELQAEGQRTALLRPGVEKRQKGEEEGERFAEAREQEAKAQEFVDQTRQSGLEKYGSEWSKLLARQKREAKEFEEKSLGAVGVDRDEARNALNDQQAAEQLKFKIGEKEAALAKLGKDPGMSAGVDVNSSAGISAINRALSGSSALTVQQQELEVQKQQLRILEEIAHGGPEAKSLKEALEISKMDISKGDAGPSTLIGSLGRGEDLHEFATRANAREQNPEVYAALDSKANRGLERSNDIYDVVAEKRAREKSQPSDIDDVLNAKRDRESKSAADFRAMLAELKAARKATEKVANKPAMKVVALSGG